MTASSPDTPQDREPDTARAGLSLAGPGDFFALMKPRVMSLVVFTAVIGLLCAVAAGGRISLFGAVAAIACIALGAGASGALNMWYDADIDAAMTRTRQRPVPRGLMAPRAALGFGIMLGTVAVWMLAVATNYVAAGLLAFTIFFYVVIYTIWLKRRTPQNIVIGGTPGALPPVIGWAAVTGSVGLEAVILFAIIFTWTPPHFWALALYKRGDYDKVGIPMLPNVAGAPATRRQILIYAVVLVGVVALPVFTGLAGWAYWIAAPTLSGVWLWRTWAVHRSGAGEDATGLDEMSLYRVKSGDRAARDLFLYSIIYLFGLFAALGIDAVLETAT